MSPVFTVFRREYLSRVRNKWFIIGTIALPLFMVAIFAGPIILEARSQDESNIAIVDETGELAAAVAANLGRGFDAELVDPTPGYRETLDARVTESDLFGYLILDAGTLTSGTAEFRADGRPGGVRRLQMQQAVVDAALANRLADSMDDVGGLLGGGDVDFVDLSREGDDGDRAAAFILGFAGSMMLYVVMLLYGVQVMRSVLEEKTSRIVEVVVSAMRPWQLMLGKILGVGAVGLTQMGIWVGTIALLATGGLPFLVAARPELAELENLVEFLPEAGTYVLFLIFFGLGYLLFSSMYAAVAAMCSSDEEAQQLQVPVTMLLVVPVLFLAPIIDDPTGAFGFWLSMFPFFSPVLMFPRFVGGAPLWQPLVSIVLMVLTIVAVAWVAGRIYRVGILMQGKRPTLPELWRWIREA